MVRHPNFEQNYYWLFYFGLTPISKLGHPTAAGYQFATVESKILICGCKATRDAVGISHQYVRSPSLVWPFLSHVIWLRVHVFGKYLRIFNLIFESHGFRNFEHWKICIITVVYFPIFVFSRAAWIYVDNLCMTSDTYTSCNCERLRPAAFLQASCDCRHVI